MTHSPAFWQFWDQPWKVTKWVVAQILENPHPFLKIIGMTLPLISLWNELMSRRIQPCHVARLLSPSEMAHPLACGVCFSLDKSTSDLISKFFLEEARTSNSPGTVVWLFLKLNKTNSSHSPLIQGKHFSRNEKRWGLILSIRKE